MENAKVIVYGIGGVGSFVVEGLVRAGIGNIVLVDPDEISISNLNRQIHATQKSIGKSKIEIMKERILEINSKIKVEIYKGNEEKSGEENLINSKFSYVVDAIDTVTNKLKIIVKAKEVNVPVISCMGTGNKLDPSKLEIVDISKTSICPLAKVMRRELKKRNIKNVKVLYSSEEPKKPNITLINEESKKVTPGSISFVPSVAGLMIAGEVVRDIINI